MVSCGGLVSPDAFWATVVVSGVLRGVWSVARKGAEDGRATGRQMCGVFRSIYMRDRGPVTWGSAVSEKLRKFVRAQHERPR
jgi:hypothetical protein